MIVLQKESFQIWHVGHIRQNFDCSMSSSKFNKGTMNGKLANMCVTQSKLLNFLTSELDVRNRISIQIKNLKPRANG